MTSPSSSRPDDAASWDARYSDDQQVWSGHPNGALVDEVSGLLAVHHAGFAKHVEERSADDGHGDGHGDRHGDGHSRGFDVASYVSIDDVRALLDDDWQVDVHEERPRALALGAGAHHTVDVVVRALRRGSRALDEVSRTG